VFPPWFGERRSPRKAEDNEFRTGLLPPYRTVRMLQISPLFLPAVLEQETIWEPPENFWLNGYRRCAFVCACDLYGYTSLHNWPPMHAADIEECVETLNGGACGPMGQGESQHEMVESATVLFAAVSGLASMRADKTWWTLQSRYLEW
jgi:hypothetical protein